MVSDQNFDSDAMLSISELGFCRGLFRIFDCSGVIWRHRNDSCLRMSTELSGAELNSKCVSSRRRAKISIVTPKSNPSFATRTQPRYSPLLRG